MSAKMYMEGKINYNNYAIDIRFLNHGVLSDKCYVTRFTEFTNGFSSMYILDERTAHHISARGLRIYITKYHDLSQIL